MVLLYCSIVLPIVLQSNLQPNYAYRQYAYKKNMSVCAKMRFYAFIHVLVFKTGRIFVKSCVNISHVHFENEHPTLTEKMFSENIFGRFFIKSLKILVNKISEIFTGAPFRRNTFKIDTVFDIKMNVMKVTLP